jgi:hypothetical protein
MELIRIVLTIMAICPCVAENVTEMVAMDSTTVWLAVHALQQQGGDIQLLKVPLVTTAEKIIQVRQYRSNSLKRARNIADRTGCRGMAA